MSDLLTFFNAIIIDPLKELEANGSITVNTKDGKITGQNIGLQGTRWTKLLKFMTT